MRDKAGLGKVLGLLCCAFGATACLASAAQAADTVYWSSNADSIRAGNLSGTGSPSSLFTGESGARGVSIDPATGKIYWTTGGGATGDVRVGTLNGSSAAANLYSSEDGPEGAAVDHTSGKIYWATFNGGTIRVANLNGTGAASTLFVGEAGPVGIAIDPTARKIYWTDSGSGLIRVGNIDGSGSASTLFSMESDPRGVAIDPTAGKIYWADNGSGLIRVGNLNGTGTPSTLFSGEVSPIGVAIDPAASKVYWGGNGSGLIRVGNMGGTGSPSSLFTGENGPKFPTLLRSPVGTAAPQIAGGTSVGSTLSCSQGSWAPDLLGASLYRAPQSLAYSWKLNGAPVGSATSNTLTATSPGQYACRVTAANFAGGTSQTSAGHGVPPPTPTITKAKIRSSKRTARFGFKAAGATGFQCALIRKKHKKSKKKPQPHFSSCNSTKSYKHLKPGKYTFEVRALSGGIAGVPATKNFKIG